MTTTQLLLISIAGLSLFLGADLLWLSWSRRRKPQIEVEPGFRRVGTFGSLKNFEGSAEASFQAQGQGPAVVVAALLLIVLAAGGIVFKVSWDEAHPDIRTRYGRAFEYCVAEEGISRWDKAQVDTCIRRLPVG